VVDILVQEIKDCVTGILAEKINILIEDETMYYKGLIDIGLNSLLFIKLLVNLEAELDIEFEEDLINSNHIGNLDQLIAIVADMVKI
jgi:acyl carrier protein